MPSPAGVARIDVRSAAEMAGDGHVASADIFVAVAAVADYTPADEHAVKLKKSDKLLKPTIDVLATVASRSKPPFCVGFAAETNDVHENAEAKRWRKKVQLLIANHAQHALGQDDNEVTLLDHAGVHPRCRARGDVSHNEL